MNSTLAIFAKAPLPGRVKTRLCPPLTPDSAARLAGAFFRDTVAKALSVTGNPVIHFDGERAALEDALRAGGINGGGIGWMPQRTGDLGARMARVPAPCVIIGTDSPSVPVHLIERAFRIVETGRIAIGPALDGGYYLIGLPRQLPELFANVDWSTNRVLTQTLDNARRAEMLPVFLPEWYDVDMPEDLARLDRDLSDSAFGNCPETRRVWTEIREEFLNHGS